MRNLIKLFFIVSLMSAPAFAATLFVPDDYPTIQEAVDAAVAGDRIEVGPGEYAGAVIDRVPVIIEGSGDDTRITMGNDFKFWPGDDAFDIFGEAAWPGYCNDVTADPSSWVPCGGDGTQIRNLWIDGLLYGGYVVGAADVEFSDLTVTDVFVGIEGEDADRFTVTYVDVIGTIHGIAYFSGNVCTITDNEIRDFKAPGHANGIIAFGNDCLVQYNTIFHVGEQVCNDSGSPCGLDVDEAYVGINVGPYATNNVVVDNDVTIAVSDPDPVVDGRLVSKALSIQSNNNTFLDNHLTGVWTDGVCQISTIPLVMPAHFYIAGCVLLTPPASLCSAPSTPPGCNTFEGNDLDIFDDIDGDSVANSDDFCPDDTVVPEGVPTMGYLKPNHWALTVTGNRFDFDTVIKGKGEGPNRSYTIEDTAGCSCEQIIEIQGLGDAHTKNGCSTSAMDDWIDFLNTM